MGFQDFNQQSISIVFNALALGSYQPKLFRIRPASAPGLPPAASLSPSVLDLLTVDATISEIIDRTAEVTDHPVEVSNNDTSSVSDHVRIRPLTLRLEGVISDSPYRQSDVIAALQAIPPVFGFSPGIVGNAAAGFVVNGAPLLNSQVTRSQEAYETLADLFQAHELVSLVTLRDTFDSMMMTKLTIPRDARTGAALRFSAEFVEVITVADQVVQLPVALQPQLDLGNQPTPQAPAGVQGKVQSGLSSAIGVGGPGYVKAAR
jgi:hypothetical protein